MYELSTSFVAHKADIVGLAVNADDSIITCSKDKTIKIWKYNESTQTYFEADIFHSKSNLVCKFPTCVCILRPSDLFECGLIVTGDNDNRIFVYEPSNPIPIRHTRAHTNAVSRIAHSSEPNVFLSASWDTTVKMWLVTEDNLKCLFTILSHSASVWAVLQMKRKFILTGSADKLIRIFDVGGKLVNTLYGHEDCVRDLAEVNDQQILSCSNDSTVRRWSVDSGKCLEILSGHPNYVYSVRIVKDLIVSSGEDKCLLLWSRGKPRQTITLAARSIWTLAVLSNNDIVVGSSDGIVRIFTASKKRRADEKTLLSFTEECSNRDPIKVTMGRKRFHSLPGANILSDPGVREGQRVFVRLDHDSDEVNCFSWSLIEKKWKNDGVVDVDFTPIVCSNFKSKAIKSNDGEDDESNSVNPRSRFCCAICRRKFTKKCNIRKHVIESNHTIARKTPKFLLSMLPNMCPYHIISFERKGSTFRLKLCLENLSSRNDLQSWVKKFAELSNCVYWKFNYKRYGHEGSSYSEFYRCQYYCSSRNYVRQVHSKDSCKSSINAVLKLDSVTHSYYGKINVNFCHNHPIQEAAESKKPSKPSPEVRATFRRMCRDGFTPSEALRAYRLQLKTQSPDLLQDRSVCPDYDWVRHFFRKTKAPISTPTEMVGEAADRRLSTDVGEQPTEIENVAKLDDFYELEECEQIETQESGSEDGAPVAESNVNVILQVVHEFGMFLAKLGEDPSYYREGIQSMSRELKKLCESSAESRLVALYSFNKSVGSMER